MHPGSRYLPPAARRRARSRRQPERAAARAGARPRRARRRPVPARPSCQESTPSAGLSRSTHQPSASRTAEPLDAHRSARRAAGRRRAGRPARAGLAAVPPRTSSRSPSRSVGSIERPGRDHRRPAPSASAHGARVPVRGSPGRVARASHVHRSRQREGAVRACGGSVRRMLAAYAARIGPDDPLSALEVGERPEPDVPGGLGPGARPRRQPQPPRPLEPARRRAARRAAADDPRLRRRGRRRRRPRGRRPRRDQRRPTGAATRRSTRKRSLLSERYQGTFADEVVVPRRNLVPKPAELTWEEAACLPTAWLTAYRMLFTQSGARARRHACWCRVPAAASRPR